ncbi:MAG: GerAB/ArcD/ProY family transporter [Christensenellales bacterium]
MKRLVTTRQLSLILIISLITLKGLLLPPIMAKDLGRDSYIFAFVLLFLDFLVLLSFLFVMNKYPGQSFFQILQQLFGVVIAKIIMFFFFCFFFVKCCIIFQANFVYLNENLYTTFNWLIFAVPILFTVVACAMRGVTAFARLVEFFFPVIIVGVFTSMGAGVLSADFSNLLPFMEFGLSKLPKVFSYALWFGDYLIMIVFFGNVKTTKKFNLRIILSISGAILGVVAFIAIFYSIHNYSAICHTNAISDMLQTMPLSSDVGSFDWILIILWDISLFLFFTMNILGAFYSFRMAFFDQFHIPVAIGIVVLVYVANRIVNFDIYFTIEVAQKYIWQVCLFVQYFLPAIIFLFALFKKHKQNNKTAGQPATVQNMVAERERISLTRDGVLDKGGQAE